MSFSEQVKALVIKDFQVAKRSRAATIAEMIAPIFAACIAGVLILVLSIVSTDGDEWSDTNSLNVSKNASFFKSDNTPDFAKQYLDQVDKDIHSLSNREKNFSLFPVPAFPGVFGAAIAQSFESHDNAFGINATVENEKNLIHLTFATILADQSSITAGTIGTILGALFFNKNASFAPQDKNGFNSHTWYRPLYLDINLRAIFASTGMLMLLYAFIPSALINGGRLVAEKKNKVRESLRVMGVSDSAYVTAHFISMFIRLFMGCLLIAIVLLAFKAIDGSAVLPVLGLSVIFCISMLNCALLMPALFTVDVWTNVFNIFFVAGAAALSQFTTGSDKGIQILVCLLSPGGYYYAILPYLSKGSIQLNLSSGEAALMMIIDSVLYFVIAHYVYNVFPGEYGVPKSKLYFLEWIWKKEDDGTKHHRLPAVSRINNNAAASLNSNNGAMSPANNDGKSGLEMSRDTEDDLFINIKGLVKHFPSNPTPSVDYLDYNVRRGEISCLLGHNGAGKSTTMNVLTGLLDATSYESATVNGYDLKTQMDKIRADLGLCPQFEVLFESLDARQHLELFCRIKGKSATDPYINELMKALTLPEGNDPVSVYSGGTRRRLATANALVGGSSLLIFDEPSSGMDPVSRRRLWSVLKEAKKQGKTLIVTTHYMEEADFLGDRIAIMSAGKMKVFATSTELKHKFDVGYTLTTTKQNRNISADAIFDLVKKHCPAASLKIDSDAEAQFLVPTDNLTPLLVELEARQAELHVESYGIDSCTLEDVFVRLASEEEEERHRAREEKKQQGSSPPGSTGVDISQQREQVNERSEDFERKYHYAQSRSSLSKLNFQIKITILRCFRQLNRSAPVKVFAILFPLFFLLLGFLTLQPNQNGSKGNFGKTYDWIDFSTDDLNLVMVDLHHDANAPYIDKFETEFNALWRERVNPKQQNINWYVANSYTDFATGQYVPLHGFTFTGPKSPPVYGGVIPHAWDPTSHQANYTLLWTQRYDPVLSIPYAACVRAAMDKVIGNVDADNYQVDNFTFVSQQINYDAIIDKILNESGKPHTPESPDEAAASEQTYNVMVLGLYFVLSIGQLVSATQRGYADELSRKIYRVMLLNGLQPTAHVIGNFLYGFIVSLWALVILVVGLYMKGIDSVLDGGVIGPVVLAAVLFIVHTILFAQWFISYFPGKTPVAYTLIVHLYNIASMGAPYLIDKLFNVGKFSFQPGLRPYLLSFFPSCAFYHVFDVAASVPPSVAKASRLFELSASGDHWTDDAKTGWAFVFLGLELLIPLILLYNFTHTNGVYAWMLTKREGADIKGANAQKSADSKNFGEQQALLSAQDNYEGNANNSNNKSRGSLTKHDQQQQQQQHEHNNNNNIRHSAYSLNVEDLEDDDVRAERARTSRQPSQLTLDHLRRTFNGGAKVAVNNLSIGIEEHEVVSLLGPNGCGKTTTILNILREIQPTSGNIEYLKGQYGLSKTPVLETYKQVRLGVCLQSNSLWGYLTAREHMEYYLQLRLLDEYRAEDWKDYIDQCLIDIGLNDVETKQSEGYSGGMVRKLMTQLAMRTFSHLIVLDEPSTGLDANSRRSLWHVIKDAVNHHSASILLVTHAMDEAQAVSNRIGIMTGGVLRCIGTPQQLKSKYGANFIVTVELEKDVDFTNQDHLDAAVEKIRGDLGDMFVSASMIEHVGSLCRFQVANIPSLATAFQRLDTKKRDWKVRTYNVAQMANLEQIFVNMVKTGGGNPDEEAM